MAKKGLTQSVVLSNGVKMPWLGLGTWRAGDQEAEQSVQMALDAGYRHIDTAAMYQNEQGIGRAIRASGVPREEVFITTKLWNEDQRKGPTAIRQAFDQSLQRLGTDYVDLYLVHWPVKGKYRDAWRTLQEIYASGRAKAIGVSNFLVHHLKDVLGDGGVGPMVNQYELHPWLLQPALLEFCKACKIVPEAWAPLGQGKVFEIPELREIAGRCGRTVGQVVLRWEVQHGVVTIPKSVHRERIEENAGIFDFELSAQDMARIDRLDREHRIGPHPDQITF